MNAPGLPDIPYPIAALLSDADEARRLDQEARGLVRRAHDVCDTDPGAAVEALTAAVAKMQMVADGMSRGRDIIMERIRAMSVLNGSLEPTTA